MLPRCILTLLVLCHTSADESQWRALQLPDEHIPYYFYNNPDLEKACEKDPLCPYQDHLGGEEKCWGYEADCPMENRMAIPQCPQDTSWEKSKPKQLERFMTSADFDYVKARSDELTPYCASRKRGDSLLECADHARYCRAKHIYMDFREVAFKGSRNRYREDLFTEGQIGGHCEMDKAGLEKQGDHKSALQSWYGELQHYTSLDFKPSEGTNCDITLEKPTILMKLDAGVNMFHHFCDFLNLYAAQHLNNSFNMDINIVMWDTSEMHYGDFFHVTWQAFSKNPIMRLNDFEGKRVCIPDAVFPLLPRMRYGMFYNMPLIPGCQGSSLFRAFSQHVLHRLNITQEGPLENKIRVTLLTRNTKYRNIMNQDELVKAMKTVGHYDVRVVEYNRQMTFLEQLQSTHNSDIFMGMHGAGLTHLLFLPDWASFMEIYNCEDLHCYHDLSRLRGVEYFTWEKMDKLVQEDEGHHPTLGAHAKFTNYAFDVEEFMRLVAKAAEHVKSHKKYQEAWDHKYGNYEHVVQKRPREEL